MSRHSRFKAEQKLKILREVEEHGLAVTLGKHGLYTKSIYQFEVSAPVSTSVIQQNDEINTRHNKRKWCNEQAKNMFSVVDAWKHSGLVPQN
ncbi:MAG: hypothetical protein HYX66_10320 [Ignavibacteria bacterium]|nr:hypothetical protein [Ignavibacteria bacterium]